MAAGVRQTRQHIAKNIVKAQDLPTSDLPTIRDMLAKMVHERDKIKVAENKIQVEVSLVSQNVLPEIKALYRKVNSNIVVYDDKTILRRLTTDYKQMKELERSGRPGKQRQNFEIKLEKLFDILYCKCQILTCEQVSSCDGCDFLAHCICECDDEKKIPEVELQYVLDQRSREGGSKGKYQMGGKDVKEIEEMEENEKEKAEKIEKKLEKIKAAEIQKAKEKKRVAEKQTVSHEDLDCVLDDIDPENNPEPEVDNADDEDF